MSSRFLGIGFIRNSSRGAPVRADPMSSREAVRQGLLQVFFRLGAGAASRRPATDAIQRILVLRPDHLGDVLLTTPALALLRQSFPHARITYLVGPWSEDVAGHIPDVDETLTCPFPGMGRRAEHPWQPYLTLLRYRRLLRPRRFDLAINLRDDFWWGAVLAYLCAIPRRVGYGLEPARPFLTLPLALSPADRHVAAQNLALVRAAAEAFGGLIPAPALEMLANPTMSGAAETFGDLSLAPALEMLANPTMSGAAETFGGLSRAPEPGALRFIISPEEQRWATERLAREGITPGTPTLVLHPGTGALIKLWTAAGWATVADTLIRRYKARLLITAKPDEMGLAAAIAAAMQESATIIADPLSIGQLAALLKGAMLVLGVDSGPLHLAVAVGTPSVHLFGPTDPQRFGPYGDPACHRVVQTSAIILTCVPCGGLDYTAAQLPAHPCLRQIVPAQVIQAAEEVLRRKG